MALIICFRRPDKKTIVGRRDQKDGLRMCLSILSWSWINFTHTVYSDVNKALTMGGSKGIPQYSWEYPTILVHLYVYMYVYLYIHMYNAIFYNTFAHSSPKQLKKRPFSLASAVSTDHSPLVKAPCCSPFCLCSCNFQPKI